MAEQLQAGGGSNRTEAGGNFNLPMVISVPILSVIVVVVVVLLLLLLWLSFKSKRKGDKLQAGTGYYNSVPTEDYADPTNKNPPYFISSKQKVQLMEPPVPGVSTQFVEATQLGLVLEGRGRGGNKGGMGSRYPFTTGQDSRGSSSEKDHKFSRKSSNRRSRHGGLRQTSDRSSDGSEDSYSSPSQFSSTIGSAYTSHKPSPERRMIRAMATAAVEKDHLPELFMCLFYNEEEAMLTVKVERAIQLPYRADGALVDTYVRLFFIPKLPEMPQRKTGKTEIKRQDNSPVFNEEVQYEAMSMEELINSVLHVEVLDYRFFGKHQVLGQADVSLVQIQFVAGEAPLTLPLTPPMVRRGRGVVDTCTRIGDGGGEVFRSEGLKECVCYQLHCTSIQSM